MARLAFAEEGKVQLEDNRVAKLISTVIIMVVAPTLCGYSAALASPTNESAVVSYCGLSATTNSPGTRSAAHLLVDAADATDVARQTTASSQDACNDPPALPSAETGTQTGTVGAAPVSPAIDEPATDTVGLWPIPLLNGNDQFARAMQAITGKTPSRKLQSLLHGVTRIHRDGDAIIFEREDNQTLTLDRDTEVGVVILDGLDQGFDLVNKRFGKPAAELLAGIKGVRLEGSRITIESGGPDRARISTKEQKQSKRYIVKGIRFSQLAFEVTELNGHIGIKNAEGCSVTLKSGIEVPIQVREFYRSVDEEGNNVFSLGIKNPMPRPISFLLGLDPVLHFCFVERKHGDERHFESVMQSADASPLTPSAQTAPRE